MKTQHLPAVSPRFWIAISLASVLGANVGDLVSHDFGLGHVNGLPYLAAVFAAALLIERLVPARTEAFYWFAIVTLRTAATNIGDLGTHDWKLDDLGLAGLLALVLAVAVAMRDRRARPFMATGKPETDGLYWFTMLAAGTLGTALGDGSADQLSLGVATGVWLATWAVCLGATLRLNPTTAVAYWGMVCVIRTVGTNLGDWLAGRHGLQLSLPAATALSAVLLVGLLALWPARRPVSEGIQSAAG